MWFLDKVFRENIKFQSERVVHNTYLRLDVAREYNYLSCYALNSTTFIAWVYVTLLLIKAFPVIILSALFTSLYLCNGSPMDSIGLLSQWKRLKLP